MLENIIKETLKLDSELKISCFKDKISDTNMVRFVKGNKAFNYSVNPFLERPELEVEFSHFLSVFYDHINPPVIKQDILSSYFDTNFSKNKFNKGSINFDELINECTLNRGRRKGHTTALLDFILDPKYEEIVTKTTFILNQLEINNFTQKLDHRCFNLLMENKIDITSYCRSVHRFNDFFVIHDGMIKRSDIIQLIWRNKHFLLLGDTRVVG